MTAAAGTTMLPTGGAYSAKFAAACCPEGEQPRPADGNGAKFCGVSAGESGRETLLLLGLVSSRPGKRCLVSSPRMMPPPSVGVKRAIRLISAGGPFTSPHGSQKLYESP